MWDQRPLHRREPLQNCNGNVGGAAADTAVGARDKSKRLRLSSSPARVQNTDEGDAVADVDDVAIASSPTTMRTSISQPSAMLLSAEVCDARLRRLSRLVLFPDLQQEYH